MQTQYANSKMSLQDKLFLTLIAFWEKM